MEIVKNPCEVCKQPGHGRHFGAITCRACAAFFRRVATSKTVKPCKRENNCTIWKSGWFNCKKCRLQRCWDVGMTMDNFQFDRDVSKADKLEILQSIGYRRPETMNTFLGRSNLIIFTAPHPESPTFKTFIDVHFLVEKSKKVLELGSESPLHPEKTRCLQKLALGLRKIRGIPRSFKFVTRVGREETMESWQEDVLKVARWLTYFDDFRGLAGESQLAILSAMWKVWTRLENLAVTCIGRRQNFCDRNQLMLISKEENLICDMKKIEFDFSWISKYTLEQLKFFAEPNFRERGEDLIQMMLRLDPSDIELSFMLCQLCFHYIVKRYHGEEIQVIAERFLEVIADDLHHYYVDELNMPNYSRRLANLMKINNHIQQDIYRSQEKGQLAVVFDIFHVEFSHPEMFVEW